MILTNHSDLENCFTSFYKKLWSSSSDLNYDSWFSMLPDDYPILGEEGRVELIKPISKREVYQTLTSMRRCKSPGPDGLNVDFYVFYWNIIGGHFFNAISYFFNTARIPPAWGKTFMALLLKKDNAMLVSDFRPIFLCNVYYKVIAKILANHLRNVISNLVGPEQNGFISRCGTYDNIIAAQEIAHNLETDSSVLPRMIIKIDVEKAFDTLEWNVVIATLRRMLFPKCWITWIRNSFSSASFSFIFNGKHSGWINSSRGVRQGDPLSPLLFILTSQTLTAILNKARSLNLVRGFNNNLPKNLTTLCLRMTLYWFLMPLEKP